MRHTDGSGPPNNITLVELKFCRDSDPTPPLERAKTQHTLLKTRLEQLHQCSVQILPILIGVSGAVYRQYTAEALQQLGVRSKLLKTTLRQLHTQAVQALRDIVSARRRRERRRKKAGGRRGRIGGGTGPTDGRDPAPARGTQPTTALRTHHPQTAQILRDTASLSRRMGHRRMGARGTGGRTRGQTGPMVCRKPTPKTGDLLKTTLRTHHPQQNNLQSGNATPRGGMKFSTMRARGQGEQQGRRAGPLASKPLHQAASLFRDTG